MQRQKNRSQLAQAQKRCVETENRVGIPQPQHLRIRLLQDFKKPALTILHGINNIRNNKALPFVGHAEQNAICSERGLCKADGLLRKNHAKAGANAAAASKELQLANKQR